MAGITWWHWDCVRLCSQNSLKSYPESLGPFTPSPPWGHRHSQNDLQRDLLSVGEGASSFRDEVHEGVYITAFFENKPKAAMENGLKCMLERDKSLWK